MGEEDELTGFWFHQSGLLQGKWLTVDLRQYNLNSQISLENIEYLFKSAKLNVNLKLKSVFAGASSPSLLSHTSGQTGYTKQL